MAKDDDNNKKKEKRKRGATPDTATDPPPDTPANPPPDDANDDVGHVAKRLKVIREELEQEVTAARQAAEKVGDRARVSRRGRRILHNFG